MAMNIITTYISDLSPTSLFLEIKYDNEYRNYLFLWSILPRTYQLPPKGSEHKHYQYLAQAQAQKKRKRGKKDKAVQQPAKQRLPDQTVQMTWSS